MQELITAEHADISLGDQGELLWNQTSLARLCAGANPLQPALQWVDKAADAKTQAVRSRLETWLATEIHDRLEPLLSLQQNLQQQNLEPVVQHLAQKLLDGLGAVDRRSIARELRTLEQEQRGQLRQFGVRFGEFSLFFPALLRPAPSRLLALLLAFGPGGTGKPYFAPPGLTSLPATTANNCSATAISAAGLRKCGVRLIRLDMLERVGVEIRNARQKGEKGSFCPTLEMVALLGCSKPDLADILTSLGYVRDKKQLTETGEVDELTSSWRQKTSAKAKPAPQKTKFTKKPAKRANSKAKPKKKIDPDSPFAVLQSLKLDTRSKS